MDKRKNIKFSRLLKALLVLSLMPVALAQSAQQFADDVVNITLVPQHDTVSAGSSSALKLHFKLKDKWHFYASKETAPGEMNLKVIPRENESITFSQPLLGESEKYFDKSSGKQVDVFSREFDIYIPFTINENAADKKTIELQITIDGSICSDMQCRLMPADTSVDTTVNIGESLSEAKFNLPAPTAKKSAVTIDSRLSYSIWFALMLAFVAGLTLNIMPCVWPVLPIIVLRIVDQAKKKQGRSFTMGLAFCAGILLFFAGLAVANIILHLFYGAALQWGDQFRNPSFVAAMGLLMVVLALFMFDVFAVTVPSSISSKTSNTGGFISTIGMGTLAAILSTPCSFGILAAAFAWAQGQPLLPATIVIMTIGIGMATPYLILTSMPAVLKKLPKPGKWMELIKQTVGFILLVIAVKLMAALPDDRRMRVIYFAVLLSFCIWMWGSWVSFNTNKIKKYIIRIIAVTLALWMGFSLLPAPKKSLIDWGKYDAQKIQTAIEDNRSVLIKFTADWCLSCQTVEKIVYGRKDIADLLKQKNVLVIKADTTTRDYEATKALKNIYNEPGVPVSILFVPGEESLRWRQIRFADSLKTALEKLP
ncbi:MAG: thioredoxin family protein [Planctomycetes bacterium]|nr:thioredoxin family protein [Planctomycetota bacterium]